MAVPTVADDINNHVLFKGHPVVDCKAGYMDHCFRVLTMHVKNWDHQHFGNIRGITGGAGVFGQGGVTDLIVDNNMYGAAGAIAIQLGHVQGFHHHSLTGKCGIAVNQQWKNQAPLIVVHYVLTGPNKALYHRADGFQMARVIDQEHP